MRSQGTWVRVQGIDRERLQEVRQPDKKILQKTIQMKLENFTKLEKNEMLFVIEANKANPAAPIYLERLHEALNGHPESLCFLDERLTEIYKRLKQ
jgi:hypothetical protein